MSQFYDQASLVMVPSGYKDGKLYSQKPLSTSGELSFSRGSDIEATRIGADGLIHKAQVNLLLQSNSYSTSPWESNTTNREATLTSGQTGYDGSSDAWLVLDTTGSGQHQIVSGSLTLSGVYTVSVYAKAYSSSRYLGLAGFGLAGANEMPVFDLVNGTVDTGTTSTYFIDANIESVGSGWYRCSVTFKYTGTNTLSITLCDTATDNGITGCVYTGTGTHGFYLQDAQLNYGLVAQTYQETTTAAVVSGITNDMPRLSYDPANPTCPSLLLEPSRQNLIDQSDYIASWSGANTTVASNAGISPEGVNNATSLTFASGGYWYKSVTIAYTAGTAYTWSIYANTSAQVIKWGGATPAGTDTYTIEDAGNGWYRQIITRVVSGIGVTNFQPLMDWVNVGVGVEFKVYGAQFEASASYASSLIPTYGSSATRTVDRFTKTGISSLINSQEGTLFVEMATFKNNVGTSIFSLSDGTVNNNLYIGYATTTNEIRSELRAANTAQASLATTAFNINQQNKIAVSYKTNEVKMYVNGTLVGTDTSATMPAAGTLSQLKSDFGQGSFPLYANIKQLLIFPTALTDAQLAELTA